MSLLRVMTFNVLSAGEPDERRHVSPEELRNEWADRAALNVRTIKRYRPDLIGMQETDGAVLATYRQELDDYSSVVAGGYEDPKAIFWNSSHFELRDAGEFWLSSTPDVCTADWGVEYPLSVAWARLAAKDTGVELLHLNTLFEDGP